MDYRIIRKSFICQMLADDCGTISNVRMGNFILNMLSAICGLCVCFNIIWKVCMNEEIDWEGLSAFLLGIASIAGVGGSLKVWQKGKEHKNGAHKQK